MRWIGALAVALSLSGSAFVAASGEPRQAAPSPGSGREDTARGTPSGNGRADASAALDGRQIEFFEKSVRPVLSERCFRCHASTLKAPMGGLTLDTRAGLLRGGAAGPAVTPAEPDASPLLRAVRYTDPHLQMPPSGKLAEREIAALADWVRMGAPWPAQKQNGPEGARGRRKVVSSRQSAVSSQDRTLSAQRRHWAFQPLRQPALPPVGNRSWAANPVDRFVLARLEARRLRPGPSADRRTLIRRVTYDLIGLPPTPRDVEAFVQDRSPGAYAKVVDRLLASPHYGERWARHWLDLVRYAETRGHEMDAPIPNAWQYRDYVVRALNQDVPYDRFVTEHLAGDLLKTPRLNPKEGYNESVLGTGFWFLGEEVHSPVDIRQDETDRLDNRLDVMGKTFLGLTVGCARCHDHKFDPIAQKDYYALAGFLLSSSGRQVRFQTLERDRRIAAELDRLDRETAPRVLKAVAQAERGGIQASPAYMLEALARLSRGETAGTPTPAGRKLDPDRVERWTRELKTAAADGRHPLHLLATSGSRTPDANASACRAGEATGPRRLPESQAARPEPVLVDYARSGPGTWLADGVVFGLGPVRPGEVFLGRDPAAPIAGIAQRWAAEQRPEWNGLRLRAGTEAEVGALGAWARAGRTLKTPTVTLRSGMLRYLVRGPGRAFASVDSHTLVAGPLHGRLLRDWPAAADGWQWVTHDLRPYRGHRVHVEFSPAAAGGPLAVARVIESEADPGPAGPPDRLRLDSRGGLAPTPGERVRACGRLLLRVNDAMAAGRVDESEAALADWLARNPQLFTDAEDRERLAAATGPFIQRRARLLSRIRPDSAAAPAMLDGTGINERILKRGSYRTPGEVAPRRLLPVLGGSKPVTGPGSGRLELARRLLAHPLSARVMVNRVWQHHFGAGLVRTPDDFGTRGERPTHPELLEYLASVFMRPASRSGGLGWSLKRLHRLILLSSTYRMSSRRSLAGERADPENRLLGRMPVRRLEAEAIRDSILAVSGRLDPQLYGPPVTPYLTDFTEGRGRPAASGPLDGDGRRSLYLGVRRNFLPPLFLAFDYPVPFTTLGKRSVSTVPAQALALMNNPLVTGQAGVWARKLLSGPERSAEERLTEAYLSAFARPPTPPEREAARKFLEQQAAAYESDGETRAWADLCHVLINTKEFIFLD